MMRTWYMLPTVWPDGITHDQAPAEVTAVVVSVVLAHVAVSTR